MPSFIFETDAIPETWQFLNGLRRDDLIAELIQNELDAGATCTVIRFDKKRLICQGNGEPIDEDGWTRLRFFRGAGERAPRKKGKTGVKNHGLKACFTIGDDIIIRSAESTPNKRCMIRTVHRNRILEHWRCRKPILLRRNLDAASKFPIGRQLCTSMPVNH